MYNDYDCNVNVSVNVETIIEFNAPLIVINNYYPEDELQPLFVKAV